METLLAAGAAAAAAEEAFLPPDDDAPPDDEAALDEILSRPTPGALKALDAIGGDGDLLILGVGGKMGPTLARMARRGFDALGKAGRVIGVSRFSNPAARAALEAGGVHTLACDLTDRAAVDALPDAPHVLYLAGQKFGTTEAPETTWVMNTYAPALVAQRFAGARIVAFSTGSIYPNTPVFAGGSRETDATEPLGDYANSSVGRERVFTFFARHNRTPTALVRLNYAIDLRYGVLVDVARKVLAGDPVDVTMGHVNVIWQGDANAQALQCFAHTAVPPFVVNVTGPETVSIRQLAHRFGERFGREPVILGQEADTALLSNAGLSHRLFGYPGVPLERMIAWVAGWLRNGGTLLNKPTGYQTRNGRF
jgi:nucleoside-diphosphate-sugar epimerase